ncbi:hypothetical protein JXO52_02330 [bacterium]|nr:hypothetical protein [bacterium]
MLRKAYVWVLALLTAAMPAAGQHLAWKGQLSSWGIVNFEDAAHPRMGIRYLPALNSVLGTAGPASVDLEASVNIFGSAIAGRGGNSDATAELKPYRLWIRWATPQFEARFGLQKINFGPARMLRSLMWFDTIDPRDPLQLTDGVWGGLARYYFLNNMNLWAWVLAGNGDPRGWEQFGSDEKIPEYGGRIQIPVPSGEAGFTYHHRRVAVGALWQNLAGISRTRFMEDRYALDVRWDLAIGVWAEAALTQQALSAPFRSRRMVTIGADYTVGLGNGILITGEHLMLQVSESLKDTGEKLEFTGGAVNYPLGLLDAVTVMVYRDWKSDTWYRFLNLQRTYDRWQLFLIAFWNPELFDIYQATAGENLFSGRGVQLMAVFNH